MKAAFNKLKNSFQLNKGSTKEKKSTKNCKDQPKSEHDLVKEKIDIAKAVSHVTTDKDEDYYFNEKDSNKETITNSESKGSSDSDFDIIPLLKSELVGSQTQSELESTLRKLDKDQFDEANGLGSINFHRWYQSLRSSSAQRRVKFSSLPFKNNISRDDDDDQFKFEAGFQSFPKRPLPSPAYSIEGSSHGLSMIDPGTGQKRPMRILALDGGGVRGIIPAAILSQLEMEAGQPLHELFDLICGTSTGAILAVMLSLPEYKGSSSSKFGAKDGINLYLDKCPNIFATTFMRRIRTLAGLAGAQYTSTNKTAELKSVVGEMKISDLLTDILVPTFDLSEGQPYFFKSSRAKDPSKNCDFNLVDVLDATSSAPTYFPPHPVKGYDGKEPEAYRVFIDGAVTANSPALCGLTEAYKNYNADPDQTILVSLGCGEGGLGLDITSGKDLGKGWGAMDWALLFPTLMLSSSVHTVNYQLQNLLPPKHYFRVQAQLPPSRCDIDNVSKGNLNWLRDHGVKMAAQSSDEIKRLANMLKAMR